MPIGPQLPPSLLEKRKREDNSNSSDSESNVGPAAPASSTSESNVKKSRYIGPSLPPAPLDERPPGSPGNGNGEGSSSDDDDFGPSLPPTTLASNGSNSTVEERKRAINIPEPSQTSKRDDWMTAPPPGGDWTSRIDPTKLKNRKFNTGRSAKGPSQEEKTDTWYETPAEKQARLQRELLGVKDAKRENQPQNVSSTDKPDAATAERLKEYNKTRGPSLYEAHKQVHKVEEEDDPSARAFDREKDIARGLQINSTQRRDMLKKASDFNSRFSSAKYL